MKKVVSLILGVSLAVILSSCGGESSGPPTPQTEQSRCESRFPAHWWDTRMNVCRTTPRNETECRTYAGFWRVDGRTGCCQMPGRTICITLNGTR